MRLSLSRLATPVRVSVLVAVALTWAVGGACVPPGTLEGSVSELFDLGFDEIEMTWEDEALVVRYMAEVAYPDVAYYGRNTVAELAMVPGPEGWPLGEPVDISDAIETERFVMTMNDAYQIEQDLRRFPDIYAAELTVNELGVVPGEAMSGSFRIIFIDGLTLRGTFSGSVIDD